MPAKAPPAKAPRPPPARPTATPSPFDTRTNHKQHHAALNRKVKGANRNVALARAEALEKRAKTLGVEFAHRKSATVFKDKRFGENLELPKEEKMLRRFQKVRSKRRAGRFVLGDDAEGLTHMGQSLSLDRPLEAEDDFELEEEDAADLDEEERQHVEQMIVRLKTGERFTEGDRKLSRKEVMADIIKKARLLRAERQREKDQDEEERERLDAMALDVLSSLAPRDKKLDVQERQEAGDFDYEATVTMLSQESRAKPTDRTKTPEEVAKERLEQLQQLERERLRRMTALESDEDLGSEDEEEEEDQERRKRTRRLPKPDDVLLETSSQAPYVLGVPASHADLLELIGAHPDAPLGLLLQRILASNSIHLAAENQTKLVRLVAVLLEHASYASQAGFASAEDLDAIFDCIYRVCIDCPGPCAQVFAKRLEQQHAVLKVHLAQAKTGRGGDWGCDDASSSGAPLEKKGGHKGKGAPRRLEEEKSEQARLDRLRGELLTSPSRCWPGPGELAIFIALPSLFSATDAHHPIVLAGALLLARTLVEAPLRGPRDVVSAVEAARVLQLSVGTPARRLVPEVILCLRAVLEQLAMEAGAGVISETGARLHRAAAAEGYHGAFEWLRRGLRETRVGEKVEAESSALKMLGLGEGYGVASPAMCVDVVVRVCNLCEQVARDLTGIECLDALLGPLTQPLARLAEAKWLRSQACKDACKRAGVAIATALTSSVLRPLHWQSFVAEPVGELNPRFGEQAAEAKEGQVERALRRKLVRERKGVARELRRDGQFVAEARAKERSVALSQIKAERRANFHALEQQQGEFNAAVRMGFKVKGAGKGGLSLKGRRMGTKEVL